MILIIRGWYERKQWENEKECKNKGKSWIQKDFVNKILKQLVSSFAKWGITNSQCCSQNILRECL